VTLIRSRGLVGSIAHRRRWGVPRVGTRVGGGHPSGETTDRPQL